MAALNRPTEATYTTHEQVTVDTEDREDHTFCGIMFPVKCKELLPLDHVVIHSVAVRGRLGPITVWVSNEESSSRQRRGFRMNPRFWTKIYERSHGPSFREYVELDLRANPIKLLPGQTRAIYIHSTLPGDEAIVYDNRHSRRTYDDALVSILTGRAHVSTRPFGDSPIWGWGNPWRDHREFVGRLEYGAVYRLWNPQEFHNFGDKFQQVARALFLCQRRWESPWSLLPDECIFYILNMCRWDWSGDSPVDMKALRKKKKRAAQAAEALMQIEREEANIAAAAVADSSSAEEDDSPAVSCCHRRSQDESETNEVNDEYHETEEEEAEDEIDEDFDDEFDDEEEFDEDDDDEDDDDEDDDDEDDDDEDDEEWDSDDGYGANHEVFEVQDDDSDEEEETETTVGRRRWIPQFARMHVLQALVALDDNGVEEMNH